MDIVPLALIHCVLYVYIMCVNNIVYEKIYHEG